MRKQTLWKDIKRAITRSKGRFFSIAALMAIGSFALVGLRVAGPDMRATSTNYYRKLNVSDLTVVGDYGITSTDQKLLNDLKGVSKVEYGYLKDVTIRGTDTSIRLFSKPDAVSKYQVVDGQLPTKDDEIALDATYRKRYKIGQTIEFIERVDASGGKVLRRTAFKIVGFVNSGEIVSNLNRGAAKSGTGELEGFGVIMPKVFDSEVYMVARMRFDNLITTDPYSRNYTDKLQSHKVAVAKAFKQSDDKRLNEVKDAGKTTIAKNKKQLKDTPKKIEAREKQLKATKKNLDDEEKRIATSESELKKKQVTAQKENTEGSKKLTELNTALEASKKKLEGVKPQLDKDKSALDARRSAFNKKKGKLTPVLNELNQANGQLKTAQGQVSATQRNINSKTQQINSKRTSLTNTYNQHVNNLNKIRTNINSIQQRLANEEISDKDKAALQKQLTQENNKYKSAETQFNNFKKNTYDPGLAQIANDEKQLNSLRSQLTKQQNSYNAKYNEYKKKEKSYNSERAKLQNESNSINSANTALTRRQNEYTNNVNKYQTDLNAYQAQKDKLAQALEVLGNQRRKDEDQIAKDRAALKEKRDSYDKEFKQFQKEAPDALQDTENGEVAVTKAEDKLENLKTPNYTLYDRRQMAGSDGYKNYPEVSYVLDAFGNVFPVILFVVAALLTFATMGRFVREERTQSGLLLALGYDAKDISLKFIVFGFAASLAGSLVGIVAGHTLFPIFVFKSYDSAFTLPSINFHINLWISLIALLLSLVAAVVPAYLSTRYFANADPATLMRRKTPAPNQKIRFEQHESVWNQMGFMSKTTIRNLARYKRRGWLTIFGVAGAVALLFAAWGVRSSIKAMDQTQFDDLIHYNLVVTKNSDLTKQQQEEYDAELKKSNIKSSRAVHYEQLTKTVGKAGIPQEITMIVPENDHGFDSYMTLRNRKGKKSLKLDSSGAIISERLAQILKTKVGDTISVNGADGKDYKIKVTGITEMYMGHYLVMSRQAYEKSFETKYATNGNLLRLKKTDTEEVAKVATGFMKLSATAGVVQNVRTTNQITAIGNSLAKVMFMLIVVTIAFAFVVLFNTANINVVERLRELSLMRSLGFYTHSVTRYLFKEIFRLALVGLLLGFVIGEILLRFLLIIIRSDQAMFNPSLVGVDFLWPAVVVVALTIVIAWLVNRHLSHVKMTSTPDLFN